MPPHFMNEKNKEVIQSLGESQVGLNLFPMVLRDQLSDERYLLQVQGKGE